MMGSGGDKAARQDMFPTQVPDWQVEKRLGSPPIGKGSSFDVKGNPVGEHLRVLGRLRDEHPALSTGSTIVRLADSTSLVVSRVDGTARREYVEAFNGSAKAVKVTVQTATPGATWAPLLGTRGRGVVGERREADADDPAAAGAALPRRGRPARPRGAGAGRQGGA